MQDPAQELKDALQTSSDATIFRKLNELSYWSSYSHRGPYYTLGSIPRFDELGLWSFRSVWFSIRGTLLATAEALINESEQGFFETELESLLHVEVRGCLLKLIKKERVYREKVFGRYLYCSRVISQRKRQIQARRVISSTGMLGGPIIPDEVLPDELKAAIVLFFALLDEKQRRIYAGLESLKIGHGGDQRIAELLGISRNTVAKGREELLAQDVEVGRTRKRGGGRNLVEKNAGNSRPHRKADGGRNSWGSYDRSEINLFPKVEKIILKPVVSYSIHGSLFMLHNLKN